MVVTLEVLKLSGWSNADASLNIKLHQAAGVDVCVRRVQGVMAGRQRKGCVVDHRSRMCVWLLPDRDRSSPKIHHTHTPLGYTHLVSVTLEVMKLSGWLNFEALKNIPLHTKQQERMCVCVVCRCYSMAGRQRKGCVVDPHCKMCVRSQDRDRSAQGLPHAHAPGVHTPCW